MSETFFITLNYNKKEADIMTDSASALLSLNHNQKNEENLLKIEDLNQYNKNIDELQIIKDIPFKTHTEALESLLNYKLDHSEPLDYDQSKDQEWLQDNQVICDRLNFLRETYKCIQILKKKNNHTTKVDWFEKNQLQESDEDMNITKSLNFMNSSDQDEGSSSNTDR